MQMKKVAFFTLGCRVNHYETEAIAESFLKSGYEIVNFDEFADVYVINTCTVTSIGDKKSRQEIRRAKKINPLAIVVAAGCYSQVAPDEVSKIDEVDIIIGTNGKGKIPELVNKFKDSGKKINNVESIMNVRKFEEMEIDEYQNKTRAFLKIQDGCDRFCSYCLIPFARGPVRSKNPETVIDEVNKLSRNGYKEIILSGIHVASYGRDIGNTNLVDIIDKIESIDGVERIRIGSVDPAFFTDETIIKLSHVKKLCNHFHLSLQSGCNKTLAAMNRHYTAEEYKNAVEKLRKYIDDVSITTDVIVGFPGETDEDFLETINFIKDIKFSKIHVFKYSERAGTRAASFKNQVSPIVKEERSKILLKLDKKLEEEFIDKFKGRIMNVLFEEGNNGEYFGYTRNYIRVEAKSIDNIKGNIKDCRITGRNENTALGIII
jgi:threonylcarbamoyladenosine tRNA methylthiotransferase MtaB